MKKQLLLVALLSAGAMNAETGTNSSMFESFQAQMCEFQSEYKIAYKTLTKVLTKQVGKLIDKIPEVGKYANNPKGLGSALAKLVFDIPVVGGAIEEVLDDELGLEADDLGELMFDFIQEKIDNSGVNLDITSSNFISDALNSVLLPSKEVCKKRASK